MTTYKRYKFWVLLFLLVVFLTMVLHSQDASQFFAAINQVEAGGRRVGPFYGNSDEGKALGPMQIHYTYWLDSGVQGSYSQCTNYEYSCKVMTGYFNLYCARAYARGDWQTCARIHHGGPRGHLKHDTLAYWRKVKKHLTTN